MAHRSQEEGSRGVQVIEDFLDDIIEGSVGTFHKELRDWKNKVKELFLEVNVALFILSITYLIEEEARKVQEDADAPTDAPPSATPEATITAKFPSNTEVLTTPSMKLH